MERECASCVHCECSFNGNWVCRYSGKLVIDRKLGNPPTNHTQDYQTNCDDWEIDPTCD